MDYLTHIMDYLIHIMDYLTHICVPKMRVAKNMREVVNCAQEKKCYKLKYLGAPAPSR